MGESAITVTVGEFIEDLEDDISGFARFWVNNSRRDPEHFPAEMSPGDWDEQFLAWMTQETRQR